MMSAKGLAELDAFVGEDYKAHTAGVVAGRALREALKAVGAARKANEEWSPLGGVLLTVDAKARWLYLTATDAHVLVVRRIPFVGETRESGQLAVCKWQARYEDFGLREVLGTEAASLAIAFTDRYVTFGPCRVGRVEGRFPDTVELFQQNKRKLVNELAFNPAELLDRCVRAQRTYREAPRPGSPPNGRTNVRQPAPLEVTLEVGPKASSIGWLVPTGKMKVSKRRMAGIKTAQGKPYVVDTLTPITAEQRWPLDLVGPKGEWLFDPSLLVTALKAAPGDELTMHYAGAELPVMFTAPDYQALVMPKRKG